MRQGWQLPAKVLAGCFCAAIPAMPQAYTISAKPGVVNYVEGHAFLNGKELSAQKLKAVSMAPNDIVSTDIGKVEVLLSPGVFVRLGDNTQVRMVSPSLTDTQIELKSGTAMIEVDDLVKDNHLTVLDHNGTMSVEKPGLFRLSAGDPPIVATIEGKAALFVGDSKIEIGKGHEAVIAAGSKTSKFDNKKDDELYAWSNVRSQYDAASSYQVARNVSVNSFGGGWGDYGYSGMFNSGWLWNSGLNSWAWLPGSGAFYNPFGFGFYSPGMVGYAPVVYAPIYGGGGVVTGTGTGKTVTKPVTTTGTTSRPAGAIMAAVPVNPARPGAVGMVVSSPHANLAASSQVMHTFSSTGFATASGVRVPAGASYGGASNAGHVSNGGFVAASNTGSIAPSSSSAGHSSSVSAASSGGGHAGGGGSHR